MEDQRLLNQVNPTPPFVSEGLEIILEIDLRDQPQLRHHHHQQKERTTIACSVTRVGEISTLLQNILRLWQNFEPTLAKVLCY